MILIDDTDQLLLRDQWCADIELPANVRREVVAAILADLDAAYWREVVAEWPRHLPLLDGARMEIVRVPPAERDAWMHANLATTGPVMEAFGSQRHQVHAAAQSRVDVAAIVDRHLGR